MNIILKVKNKWLFEFRMVVSISIVYPHDGMAGWRLPLPSVTRHDFYLHIPSLANYQNSEYSFC